MLVLSSESSFVPFISIRDQQKAVIAGCAIRYASSRLKQRGSRCVCSSLVVLRWKSGFEVVIHHEMIGKIVKEKRMLLSNDRVQGRVIQYMYSSGGCVA